jgi:hypothetical protein
MLQSLNPQRHLGAEEVRIVVFGINKTKDDQALNEIGMQATVPRNLFNAQQVWTTLSTDH